MKKNLINHLIIAMPYLFFLFLLTIVFVFALIRLYDREKKRIADLNQKALSKYFPGQVLIHHCSDKIRYWKFTWSTPVKLNPCLDKHHLRYQLEMIDNILPLEIIELQNMTKDSRTIEAFGNTREFHSLIKYVNNQVKTYFFSLGYLTFQIDNRTGLGSWQINNAELLQPISYLNILVSILGIVEVANIVNIFLSPCNELSWRKIK
jgi:hypothetical protein